MNQSREVESIQVVLQANEIIPQRRVQQHRLDYRIRDDFTSESSRLLTFGSWHLHHIKPTALASAGFFYLLHGDGVQCFSCGVRIYGWRIGDVPKTVHREVMPSCQFLNNQVDDIKIESPEERGKIVEKLQASHKSPGEFFRSEECRLLSFRKCDVDEVNKWQKFAKDGFFLVQKIPMMLQCFACDGRITVTEEADANLKHERLNRDCPFLAHKPVGNCEMSSLRKAEVVDFICSQQNTAVRDAAEEVQYSENLTVQVEEK